MLNTSLLSVLRERAGVAPNDVAYTYIDHDADWDGISLSLTWAQTYRRTVNIAIEVAKHSSVGDRALILAPQGLDYIVAFLGAMHAGAIAVPLSVPYAGSHDDRVSAVFADTQPTVILTTSAAASTVAEYVGDSGATVIEIDSLDLDGRNGSPPRVRNAPETSYLQYTSGSTRTPAGVMISDRNLTLNFEQLMGAFFPENGGVGPPETTIVSWLPFYHDMGLMLAVIAPILGGLHAEIISPIAFLQRPARWVQMMAKNTSVFTAAPNFAFDLAARKTTNEDMAGLDMSDVVNVVSGSERVHAATLDRFAARFARFGFPKEALKPSYGMAEAVLYVATGGSASVVDFDSEKLAAGTAQRQPAGTGSPLLAYGVPKSPAVRIVDPDTRIECVDGEVGEIWVSGENVAAGYWNNPESSARTFGGVIADGPEGPWLRTGDLGFFSDRELFIVGRIKDLLIVYGRNHYAEDIEATVGEITGGRVAAISVPVDQTEKLVTIIELKKRGDTPEDVSLRFSTVKSDVVSAVSKAHGLNVADMVLVSPGTIPTTTSGKIRRSACVDQYRGQQFTRLDTTN
ncbi:MAG: AMP-binding protein [Mycobacterium sp.]